jgi:hypothetical protein
MSGMFALNSSPFPFVLSLSMDSSFARALTTAITCAQPRAQA